MNRRTITAVILASAALSLSAASRADDLSDWGRVLGADRWIVLSAMQNDAVLDRETQLVWQRVPLRGEFDWEQARDICRAAATGGRVAWRLPSLHELSSLYTPLPGVYLPDAGNSPFEVDATVFWTSTSVADDVNSPYGSATHAYVVTDFTPSEIKQKGHFAAVWCVRGHAATDTY